MTFATLGLAVLLAAGPDSPTPEALTQAVADLSSADADRQDAGIACAVRWGHDAGSLLPTMLALKVEARSERWPKERFCDFLEAIANPADEAASRAIVSRLAAILVDPRSDAGFKSRASSVLMSFKPYWNDILPQLRTVLRSPRGGDGCGLVRLQVAHILWHVGKDAVPDLLAVLIDPEFDSRLEVAFLLGSLGDEARPAIPTLKQYLTCDDLEIRKCCAYCLLQLDPKGFGPEARRVSEAIETSARK